MPLWHYVPGQNATSINNNTDKMPPWHHASHLAQRCTSMPCMFQTVTENYIACTLMCNNLVYTKAELDQLLLKCISITKYKKITFLKSNSNTFFNYFGYDGQNTKYKIHFLKVIKIQNNKVSIIAVRQLGVCLTSHVYICRVHLA